MRSDPSENNRKLYVIASEQAGYFTPPQAKAAGYNDRLQHYHRQRGNWEHIERGIFRLRNFPPSRWEDLVRWSLWSRDRKGEIRAVVSYETAAMVHELADYLPAKTHLTVPSNFHKVKVEGCILHRAIIDKSDILEHGGFLVTTPLRTLQDLMRSGDRDQLPLAVEQATQRGQITLAEWQLLDSSL